MSSQFVFFRRIRAFIPTKLAVIAAMLFNFAVFASAQDIPQHRWTINAGAGASLLTGDISNRLDNGWHVTFGGGYNFTPMFSAGLQVTYDGFGVSRSVLQEAAVPDGNAHMWSFTFEPKVNLASDSTINPYFVGGVGYYRRTLQFTQPTTTPVIIFDPFFGTFFQTLVPADQVLGEITRDGIGGNAGLGFDVNLGHTGSKIYAEARYQYAATDPIPMRMVPITVGLRW